MATILPVDIVARVRAFEAAVLAHGQQQRQATLAEHEEALRVLVQALLPELLAGLLQMALLGGTPGEASRPQACPGCGQRCGVQSWRLRQVGTTCGEVRYERRWYHCRRSVQGWSPFDAQLGVGSGSRVSVALQAWLVRLGATTSFAEGAELLATLTGVRLAPETVRQHTERVGTHLAHQEQVAIAQVQQTREPAEPVEAVPAPLLVEVDGVMVAYREPTGEQTAKGRSRYRRTWHEAKLGVVGGLQDGQAVATSYVGARESVEAFGPRLVAEAARRGALEVQNWHGPVLGRGLATLPEVVVVADGAPWIWNLADDHFGHRTEIVDFYHASEHLSAVAAALFGAGSVTAATWAQTQRHALWRLGAEPVQAALRGHVGLDEEARDVLRRTQAYFRTHAARMAYPSFRARGLPCGSGEVEGSARHLVQQRLKRPGTSWSEAGAHAVLTLRCRLLSNRSLTA